MSDVLDESRPAISPRSIVDEMQESYLAYAMSVIIHRALPDARDGLKPVHRRIMVIMSEGYKASGSHKKSARIVGDVMGKLHPHGDSAIYDAMVRLAQPWSMGSVLVDGQGNFGSIDGDSPAAMRYTEAKLAALAHSLTDDLSQLNPKRPEMRPNYDNSEMEPTVMPARFPNLLVNGGTGIAVGMASNIAPHNLGEVLDATLMLLARPDATLDDIMTVLPGPDFPTGGIIQGTAAIRRAYETGNESIRVSGVFSIETSKTGRHSIVITELPYAVVKQRLVEQMSSLVGDGKLQGVSSIKDESDAGIRIVVEVKRDAEPRLVLNQLRRHTPIVTNFAWNAVATDSNNRPAVMSLQRMLSEFITFRRRTIRNRSEYQLDLRRDALNEQIGLFVARGAIDEVIARIRASSDRAAAVQALVSMAFPVEGRLRELLIEVDPDAELPDVFRMSEQQAAVVVRQRISSLTRMEQDAILEAIRVILVEIEGFTAILNNPTVLDDVMRGELEAIRTRFAIPRRTRIEALAAAELTEDDLVEEKSVVVTMTRGGYIKTTPLDAFREQSRGGKGRSGMDTKDADVVVRTLICSSTDTLLFFTSRGIAHTLKAYKLPEAPPSARGRPLQNFIELRTSERETIAAVMVEPDAADETGSLMFVTSHGEVRRNPASAFSRVTKAGKIAMRLTDENGRQVANLVDVVACSEDDDLFLCASNGLATRFRVDEIRSFRSRESTGVAGMRLMEGASVLCAAVLRHVPMTQAERVAFGRDDRTAPAKDDAPAFHLSEPRYQELLAANQMVLTLTSEGYGKRFSAHEVRCLGRNTQGVEIGNFGPSSGLLVACRVVGENDGLALVTDNGQTIRTRASEVRVTSRNARGVICLDVPEGQSVVDVAVIPELDVREPIDVSGEIS